MTYSMTGQPSAGEIKAAVDALGEAFEQFREANDNAEPGRRKNAADPILEDKVNRLSSDVGGLRKTLDRLHLAAQRPPMGGGRETSAEAGEHKTAFYERYVKRGIDAGLPDLQAKAFSIGVAADGGYTVPESLDAAIENILRSYSPIRRVANVVQIANVDYHKLVNIGGATASWASETAARPSTSTPQFADIVPPFGELYANPAVTQAMLDDAYFNAEDWLAGELAQVFAEAEGAAFVLGDGVNKPKGILSYSASSVNDATRPFGTLQYVPTGVAGGWPASNPADVLYDLIYKLRPGLRQNAVFMMNTNVLNAVRKFKDSNGNYLWQPGLAQAQPASLLGYPAMEAEDMPDIAATSLSVAFGNFERGYIVTDRMGTTVLRDPFTNKPYVNFYTVKRVGGGVVNSQAIKLLKFSVT